MNIKKNTSIILMTLVLLLVFSSIGFAETRIGINKNDTEAIESVIENVNEILGAETVSSTEIKIRTTDSEAQSAFVKILEWDQTDTVTFNEKEFIKANNKDKDKFLKAFVNELSVSDLSLDSQQYIMNTIQDSDNRVKNMMLPLVMSDTEADIYTAYTKSSPYLAGVRLLFGFIAIGIVGLTGFHTLIDMAYIGFPIWRNSAAEKGGSEARPWGVTYEALSVVKQVEQNLGQPATISKNAMVMYFKSRAITYIALSLALAYLVLGQFGEVISWFLNAAGTAIS